ncbi:hypothetical protein [Vallitalea okinawensis]|uniref:hypothetical protein n=1 Tax=Vallitalea okinawensis TaxID=2078660 RepID=UPI000CFD491E|nr:hypothetical protein [Vallitalea okinawensis]
MFKKWLELASLIQENQTKICPVCGENDIDFQYIGDLVTKVGYLDIWCNKCLHGIHISRVKAPEGVNIISFDAHGDIIKRIPDFKQITP